MQKQVKTYPKKEKAIEDRYYDFGCPYYGKLFAVPSCWIRRVTINGDNNYVKARCPNCNEYHVMHL